jgi:uncharacterized RDD family membrane protein YckC|tara:strand:+ start:572 stop:1102 length:531 start_codon:yes stop_codon:yes gene_type:complete
MASRISSVGQLPSYYKEAAFKGFWIRLVAALLDSIILIIMTLIISFVLAAIAGILLGEGAGIATFLLTLLSFSVALLLYKPLMEASEYQGTFGKVILGMKVVNQNGNRLSMSESFLRTIVYIGMLSVPGLNIIGLLGLIMIGFTEQKQGLHDLLSKTFVVSNDWEGPITSQDGFGA